MDHSRGTEALVALEDSMLDVLTERLPGSPALAWPLLRYPVARTLGEAEHGGVAVNTTVSPAESRRRIIRRFAPNGFSSSRIRQQRDLLYIVSGTTLSSSEGGIKNWLVGDHAAMFPNQSIILQAASLPAHPPRSAQPEFADTFTFDDALVAVEIESKIKGLSRRQLQFAHEYVEAIYSNLDFEVEPRLREQALRQFLVRVKRERALTHAYARILDRVQPRVVMVQTASYGDRSPLIQLAHSRSIEVAEHQHGWIGHMHPAYNFGKAMFAEPLRESLPDVLLTFGEFWGDQIRTPSRRVVVGKPHLAASVERVPLFENRPKQVVFISGVHHPERAVSSVRRMRETMSNEWTIVFRPHPSERDVVSSRYEALVGQPGIVIDGSHDVFETLGKARAVVGSASTVLFEALAMNLHVFVQETTKTQMMFGTEIPGQLVRDDDHLAALLSALDELGAPSQDSRTKAERIWAPNPLDRFESYVEGFLEVD